jgi:glycosyltransferase involved in cell wall biosynthesis
MRGTILSLSKPRVLISAFTFPPANNGVANAAYIHAKIMQELGCDVQVLTGGGKISREIRNDLSITRFPIIGKGHLLSPHLGTTKQLRSFLSKSRWDIIFMHCWQVWSTNCLLNFFAKESRDERLVLVSHGMSTDSSFHSVPLNLIRRILWLPYRQLVVPRYLRLITKLVVLWDHCDNDRFFDHTLARQKGIPVNVIPNVARYNPRETKRPSLRFTDEQLADGFLLSVGNYSSEKNEFFVLDAYRHSRITDIPLIFVGHQDNHYLTRLEKIVRKWGLQNVQFCTGFVQQEIDWLYKHALVFLCGSKTECQPIVILDCLASETPYLSTDVGCVKCFPGATIVTSVKEMAAELQFLMQNPNRRLRLAKQGFDLYNKEFCYSAVKNKWGLFLSQLLQHS